MHSINGFSQSEGYRRISRHYGDLIAFNGWKFYSSVPSKDAEKLRELLLEEKFEVYIGQISFFANGTINENARTVLIRTPKYDLGKKLRVFEERVLRGRQLGKRDMAAENFVFSEEFRKAKRSY